MPVPRLLIAMLLASLPPLSADQRTALDMAFDGRDHREEAFAALLENARAYAAGAPGVGDDFVRVAPDFAAMVASPDRYRGDVCRVTGVLQQHERLERPYGDVHEWFVRPEGEHAAPVLVYVAGLDAEGERDFRDGAGVEVYARFYKRVDATARDGREHRYPAFVGAHPRLVRTSDAGASSATGVLALAFVLLLGLIVVFILIIFAARRRRGVRPPRRSANGDDDPDDLDETAGLPDDPVEALATLRRRADPRA